MGDDKVVPIRNTAANVVRALEQATEKARECAPVGVVIILATETGVEAHYNQEMRAESVVALTEIVKSVAVDALTREVMPAPSA
jgi:hypothetical protein